MLNCFRIDLKKLFFNPIKLTPWRFIVAAVAGLVVLLSTSAEALEIRRGPYLQLGTTSSVLVRWRTDIISKATVNYGTNPANLNLKVENSDLNKDHEVSINGLQPDTKYFYSVGNGSQVLAGGSSDHFFTTSPIAGTTKSHRIWVLGDSGSAGSKARSVKEAYLNFTGAKGTDLLLMLGDNAYNDGKDHEYQEAVFDMYPEVLRNTVLWSTLGNHDGHSANSSNQSGPYYDIFSFPRNGEAGGVPSGTEAYYSFDYGNIHFIVLESYQTNRSANGAMMNWLKEDAAATEKDWLIAFWHHPPYSKGSHDSDNEGQLIEMRENALPILEASGVDLVLSGHSHAYERSFLINGHYGNSDTLDNTMLVNGGDGKEAGDGAYQKLAGQAANQGAVYVVAGTSGQTSGGSLDHPAMFVSMSRLGSVVMDIKGSRLDVHFINSEGTVEDNFTLTKSGAHPCGGSFDLPNNQWRQVSLPCNPGDHHKVSDIFGNMPGTYDKHWVVHWFDSTTGSYANVGINGSLEQGVGYWIIQKNGAPVTLTMPQGSTPTPTTCSSTGGCFEIPLTTASSTVQWNMIGYPYGKAGDLSDAVVTTGSGRCKNPTGCNLDTAESQHIVHNQLWNYTGSAYTLVSANDKLNPWTSYWVATLTEAATVKPVKFLLPSQ